MDKDDRILLFSFRRDPWQVPDRCWATPGGGVHDGEQLAGAAARELWEETGLRVAPDDLGSRVAVSSGYASFPGWLSGLFRDDFFFCRIDEHDVDTSGFDAVERRNILGHRWWTVDELAVTNEPVYPLGLADLLTDLIADRIPPEPVTLTWHH